MASQSVWGYFNGISICLGLFLLYLNLSGIMLMASQTVWDYFMSRKVFLSSCFLRSSILYTAIFIVGAYVLDCDVVVSEFELQSRYYVHFQTNTFWKGMKPLISSDMG